MPQRSMQYLTFIVKIRASKIDLLPYHIATDGQDVRQKRDQVVRNSVLQNSPVFDEFVRTFNVNSQIGCFFAFLEIFESPVLTSVFKWR